MRLIQCAAPRALQPLALFYLYFITVGACEPFQGCTAKPLLCCLHHVIDGEIVMYPVPLVNLQSHALYIACSRIPPAQIAGPYCRSLVPQRVTIIYSLTLSWCVNTKLILTSRLTRKPSYERVKHLTCLLCLIKKSSPGVVTRASRYLRLSRYPLTYDWDMVAKSSAALIGSTNSCQKCEVS